MATKQETSALVLSLLITLVLLIGGLWWSSGQLNLVHLLSLRRDERLDSDLLSAEALQAHLSSGERVLIEPGLLPEKQAGVAAIATGHYSQAVTNLHAALQAQPNDPEALIYLNNARLGSAPAYTIATVVPIGADLNSALELLRGVAQAQHEINQLGGINGTGLRVMIANDDNQLELARQVATALAADPTVLAVVGHGTSDTTLAAASIYDTRGVVMVSPVSAATQPAAPERYWFRTVPSDFVTARALADYMLNRVRHQKAAIFFNSQNGYSQSLKSEVATALTLSGGLVLHEYDIASSNFSAVQSVGQAAQQGATALVLVPGVDLLDRALQIVQVNQGRLSLFAGVEFYAPKTLEIGGPDASGMVVAVPWHLLSDPQSRFVQGSRQLWWGDVSWRTAMAYDATQALIAALGQQPSRGGVQQTLARSDFFAQGATGVVRFLPSGDRNQGIQLVEIQPGVRSGYGYDFVPVGFGPITPAQETLGYLPVP